LEIQSSNFETLFSIYFEPLVAFDQNKIKFIIEIDKMFLKLIRLRFIVVQNLIVKSFVEVDAAFKESCDRVN